MTLTGLPSTTFAESREMVKRSVQPSAESSPRDPVITAASAYARGVGTLKRCRLAGGRGGVGLRARAAKDRGNVQAGRDHRAATWSRQPAAGTGHDASAASGVQVRSRAVVVGTIVGVMPAIPRTSRTVPPAARAFRGVVGTLREAARGIGDVIGDHDDAIVDRDFVVEDRDLVVAGRTRGDSIETSWSRIETSWSWITSLWSTITSCQLQTAAARGGTIASGRGTVAA